MPVAINDAGDVLTLGDDGQWKPAPIAEDPKTGSRLYLDGKEWKPLDTLRGGQENDKAGLLDNIARTVARGATFGYADELAAAGNSTAKAIGSTFGLSPDDGMNWSQRYDQNLAYERGRDKAFDASNPVISGAGQMGGGILGAMALPMATPFKGATTAATLGNTAVNASAGGAVAGFGEGEGGFGPRVEGAARGGAIGAVLGPALHGAINAGSGIANRLQHAVGAGDSNAMADRLLMRSLGRDNLSLDDLAARAEFARDPMILPDLAGRNTTSLGAVAARIPGESAERAATVTELRRGGAPDRIASAVDTAFGGGAGDDVASVIAQLRHQRSTGAAPLYEQAFEHPVTMADARKVQRYVGHDIGQEALQRGMRIIDLEHTIERKLFDPEKFGVTRSADTGRWIVDPEILKGNKAPAFRLLDAVKRGYDGIVESQRDPVTGKLHLDEWHSTVNRARADLRNELAKMNPTYAKALEAWSGPSQTMEAVQRGQMALRMNRDVTQATSERISEGDRPFFELGAGRAIADMTSDPRNAPGAARRLIEDRQMQARIASVLPEDQRRDFLIRALRQEVNMAKVDRAINPSSGSPTMPMQAAAADLGNDPAGGIIGRLLQTGTSGGLGGMASRAALGIYRRGQGINSDVADALAKRLMDTSPDGIRSTIEGLRSRAVADALARERATSATQRALTGLGAGVALEAN